MKTIAYTALRYGKEYLGAAIRSVIDRADEYHVLYATQPSHGHFDPTPPPDTKEELYAIAQQAAGDKLRWHDGNWTHEGLQRDSIFQYAPDADVILVVDSDEIWTDKVFQLLDSEQGYQGRSIKIPLIHFWRSFYKAVINDPAAPDRIIFPKHTRPDWHLTATLDTPLMHFGYAQSVKTVEYKIKIHGHKGEWRTDCDWFKDKFLANAQTDVHPCGHQWMTVSTVNPDDYLPAFMKEHENYRKALIE